MVYVLEVNPRASRTVPFVSKAIGVPMAKLAARVMAGKTLEELGFIREVWPSHVSVKEPVFPFGKFTGVDPVLGPEMRSTGEVMGIDESFGTAFFKAYEGSGQRLPQSGTVFISVKNADKRNMIMVAKQFENLGFRIVSTDGTGAVLSRNGIKVHESMKVSEGRPNVLDMIKNGEIDLIIDTPSGDKAKADHHLIRKEALIRSIPTITTLAGAMAAVQGITSIMESGEKVKGCRTIIQAVGQRSCNASGARRTTSGTIRRETDHSHLRGARKVCLLWTCEQPRAGAEAPRTDSQSLGSLCLVHSQNGGRRRALGW